MSKKLLFVFNPRSGKERLKWSLMHIVEIFTQNGYEVTTIPTQAAKDACRIVESRAMDYDLLVCSGGDGTLNEVANALMNLPKEERPVIGYIPSGSTNDMARSLGIPKTMTHAAEVIMEENPVAVDIGRFNQSHFVYCAAFGAFTEVTYMTPQEVKNVLGHQAYVLETMKSIGDIRPVHTKITIDGETIEEDVLFGMVSNSKSVGGFSYIMGPDVVVNDGLFEVSIVPYGFRHLFTAEAPMSVNAALDTMRDNLSIFKTYKGKNIHFEFEEAQDWILDGEYGGNTANAYISCLSNEIRYYLPAIKNN